ncbi:IMP dehydrogenase, partial [Staphylococcus epidermidis]|uniref:IMP dehydrogenase n=1 Tax=Staphylococcus epidermidis TaxID=1282 RepID=UPI0037DA556C
MLLIPPPSHVLPSDLDLTLKLSHNINLNIPLISPPIHTLTQSKIPIPIPPQPPLPLIHNNIPLQHQPHHLQNLKPSQNPLISNPFFLTPQQTLYHPQPLIPKY